MIEDKFRIFQKSFSIINLESMQKSLHFVFLLSSIIFCSCGLNGQGNHNASKSTSNFNDIYPLAIRGEMIKVFEILDTLQHLDEKQMAIRDQFYKRFIYENESFDYHTEDPLIIEFTDLFHKYWKAVILNKQPIEEAESQFKQSIVSYLHKSYYKSKKVSQSTIENNVSEYVNRFLKDLKLYFNADGKTAHLYDLFLWKNEEVKTYQVDLLEDTVEVEIHFMKDFISLGWGHYATLGKSYAGGWATRKALYAVDQAYDRSTENFQVSYLSHEGQHFADYISFPSLKQADLEYRAKLLELFKSEHSTQHLLINFIRNAQNQKDNAHSFANYCVIRDLSKLIFKEDFVKAAERWEKISNDLIRKNSSLLLKKHSAELKALGSTTVTELIK